MILENPDAKGLVPFVNFTTPTGSLKAHIVERAFFPTLQYNSEVAWGFSTIKPLGAIEEAIRHKLFQPKKGLSKQELSVLIDGGIQRGLIRKEISKMLNYRC